MTEVQLQEFKLEPDSELRFEVESKNEKVVLEVSFSWKIQVKYYIIFGAIVVLLRLLQHTFLLTYVLRL